MTIEQFGQTIKQKYPEYNDLSDVEVGRKTLLKYPEYQDMISIDGASSKKGLGERILGGIAGIIGGKELASGTSQAITSLTKDPRILATQNAQSSGQLIESAKKLPMGDRRSSLLQQAHQASSVDAEQAKIDLAEIPTNKQVLGSAAKLGLTTATLGTPGVASGIKGVAGLATRVAEGGLTGAAYQALSNMEGGKKAIQGNVGVAATVGGAIPLIGAAYQGIKGLIPKTGQKIQFSVIKPSSADIKDGFDINTLKKYNLGGSLGQTAHKTQDKLDDLTRQLQSRVKRTDVAVDLHDVYQRTTKKLVGDKAKNFGNIASTRRVLQNLENEIDEVSSSGLVDLAESQVVKQSAGLKGSWVFGSADPDATAVEKVYTAFYRELKEEIETKAPSGVKEINKQISELIPVMNAVIRRIPIAERNNVLSLTDVINLGVTAIHPSGAALLAINKLSKSGRFGSMLSKVNVKSPTTNIGKRIFGP